MAKREAEATGFLLGPKQPAESTIGSSKQGVPKSGNRMFCMAHCPRFGLASRELTPRVGFFENHSSRCLPTYLYRERSPIPSLVMFVIPMEATILSLVASSGVCPDRAGWSEEPLVSDLEENLHLS
ncbi:hypothetical protein GW17_00061526 [Ensete ventricosum]|nr:hypothetical protein GW17_00061526 [Ensete ventricosum]